MTPVASGDDGFVSRVHWAVVRWRDRRVGQLHRLFGPHAPIVSALLFARRDGIDRSLTDDFAGAGIAHLLAISGFHVGVFALLVSIGVSGLGIPRRRRPLLVVGVIWGYVILIGAPDAARRAAMILTAVAAAWGRGRPTSRWGALAAAALLLTAMEPRAVMGAGMQLSFAGAAGLVAWSGPWARALDRRLAGVSFRVPPSWPRAIAAACAATVATAPIAAWHFERVSIVSVPVSLLATPLVSAALPGALLALVLEPVAPPLAHFVAGGTATLLDGLVWLARTAASPRWTSLWMTRGEVVAVCASLGAGFVAARGPRVGARGRRAWMAAAVGVLIWSGPGVRDQLRAGTVEIRMFDVGQGDAIAVRTPRSRWVLFDTGRPPRGDPRAHPVVRALREAGVRELEILFLTHADADHFGGASAVLREVGVRRVVDPSIPVGKLPYVDLLGEARRLGVPWDAGRTGDRYQLDGVSFTVLAPTDSAASAARARRGPIDANETSLIVLVEWRDFRALLTGDAFAAAERSIAERVGDVDVLKVGHHGSETSTDPALLDAITPEWALVSAGLGNRYGHPDPEVLSRLGDRGVDVLRTDQHGEVRLRVDRHGRSVVRTER